MTQEEKQLLIKDLCSRLPYGVMVHFEGWNPERLSEVNLEEDVYNGMGGIPIPYLRPMSSMNEEERKELKNTTCPNGTGYFNEQYLVCPVNHFGEKISYVFMADVIDWLVSHHFDFRGLIEKGLALEAPEEMYNARTDKNGA